MPDEPAPSSAVDGPSPILGNRGLWDASALCAAIRNADPSVLFVAPRVLRRVIKEDRRLRGFGVRVPHRKSYTIDAASLKNIVERDELGLRPHDGLPDPAILLPLPTPETLTERSREELLLDYWRLLFHARIHVAMDGRRRVWAGSAADGVDAARREARRRIERVGAALFEEFRDVLRSEEWLLAPGDVAQEYVEMAAVFLELRYFAPSLLPRYLPSLSDADALAEILAEDVDHAALFAATRPAGAPMPEDTVEPTSLRAWSELPEPEESDAPEEVPQRSQQRCRRLMDRADRARAMGNVVRAAMLRVQAESFAPRRLATRCRTALQEDLDRLERRLAVTLELPGEGPQLWHESLAVLARQGARGVWTVEGRLLYDLQKICLDGQRERFAVDLIEWCLSLGRRPIQRPLLAQRDVVIAGHLASAIRRLAGARLSSDQRHTLDEMLWDASARIERRIRQTLGPRIETALDEVGLTPQNLPERVARWKLVEELLDRIVKRGFLTMSDVRDAVSRNHLILGDLGSRAAPPTEPRREKPSSWHGRMLETVSSYARRVAAATVEFFRGDQLLGVNRRLAVALDGVYHRGEVYLRWMQRIVGVAFGTATGRLLTRWAALPFVGAFVILKAVGHVIEIAAGSDVELVGATSMALLGLLLMALINSPMVRGVVGTMWKGAVQATRWTLVGLPRWLLELAWVRRALESRWFRWSWRFGCKPLAVSTVLWLLLPHGRSSGGAAAFNAAALFLLVNLLTNSRVGRMTEEVVVDWTLQAWHRFGLRFFTGLFSWIVDFFRGLLRLVERFMYAVDEWLRFRTGEGRLTFWAKAVLGSMWFFVTYVTRFCITLLIEPQINPIKHFPVVTVSHKVLFSVIPFLGDLLYEQAPRVGVELFKAEAYTLATLIIWMIPGIFGFFAWELKESWRLFAATRSRTLRPALVGDHGETMGRLLRRGFHSGTLPKRFQKLRRAERKARRHGSWRAVRKQLQALHHLETSLQHFVQRELLALLAQHDRRFGDVRVKEVRLGPVGIVARLECDRGAGDDNGGGAEQFGRLSFQSREGWITADFVPEPAVALLDDARRAVLANALVGFYKAAGVELVQQQLDALFPPEAVGVDPIERKLLVWPRRGPGPDLVVDLGDDASEVAPAPSTLFGDDPPTLSRETLLFACRDVSWREWVEAWTPPCGGSPRRDTMAASGGAPIPPRVLPEVPVLGPPKSEPSRP